MNTHNSHYIFTNYFIKLIDGLPVVWFKPSNQWVIFDEVQWYIFDLYKNVTSVDEAIENTKTRFDLSYEECSSKVNNIYGSLEKLFSPDFDLPDFSVDVDNASGYNLQQKDGRYYRYGKKAFSIVYGSPFLKEYIHLPFAYIETNGHCDYEIQWEIFYIKQRYVLRSNGVTEKCYTADEPGQIKRLLYIEMANFFYDKKFEEWMTFIHASAVKKDGKIIIFPSESGMGKSVLATILQKRDFSFFSDDFVPVDLKDKYAYSFPAAPCIKREGMHAINGEGVEKHVKSKKGTTYIDPAFNHKDTDPGKIKKVIFVSFKPGEKLLLEPMPIIDALTLFLHEAWVSDEFRGAKKFINWFAKLKFYKLEYGNNSEAIDVIQQL